MLTIRKEQFEEIGRRLAHRWEDTMVIHLETFFPERAAELGEKGVREAIDLGIEKSARYNIYTERDVCKFLNFMFALGFDFDTDPELPWANSILTNPAFGRSNLKMYLLEKAADGELEPDLEPFVPPSDEEIEAMRRQADAVEAARMAEVAREDAAIRAAELARHPNGLGDSLNMGDDDGDTGKKITVLKKSQWGRQQQPEPHEGWRDKAAVSRVRRYYPRGGNGRSGQFES